MKSLKFPSNRQHRAAWSTYCNLSVSAMRLQKTLSLFIFHQHLPAYRQLAGAAPRRLPTQCLPLFAIIAFAVGSPRLPAEDTSKVDFNAEVRPIFNQHCVACHGGVQQAGDLSFVHEDSVAAVLEPGAPEDSYLLDRVLSTDAEERMPPAEHGRALNATEIEILRRWIQQGAKWGKHWAFIAPEPQTAPLIEGDTWSRTAVDRFLLHRMRASGLQPSPAASPEQWLRRVSLDLIGLPPSAEDRERFLLALDSQGDKAFEREVDRLLSSSRFGERWASVWLDVVRYADSKGLGLDGRRNIWKYRDWVIRALNSDMPYDEFTVLQIAGDLVPNATIDSKVATACQRLTQTNEEGGTDDEQFRVEAVIDRVNTTWQAWQGLTFGCVQCHSHPYDPIQHEEYYRFMAFFNNTADCDLDEEYPTLEVPLDQQDNAQATELDEQILALEMADWNEGSTFLWEPEHWHPLTESTAHSNNTTQLAVVQVDGVDEIQTQGTVAKNTTVTTEAPVPASCEQLTAIRVTGLPQNEQQALLDSEWGFVLSKVQAWLIVPEEAEPIPLTLSLVIADEPQPLNNPQDSLNEKTNRGFGAYTRISYPRSAAILLDTPVAVPPGSRIRVEMAQNMTALGAFPLVAHRLRVATSDSESLIQWFESETRQERQAKLAELRRARKAIRSTATPILRERPVALKRQTHVFQRGNYLTKTELVSAQTPGFLPPIEHTSEPTRLDLAQWLASPTNPLTARVAVNRYWAQLFGIGIVETQEDFGSSGEPPSHPLLLDDLAARFSTEMGWSVKTLLRELTLSAAYRQSSATTTEQLEKDPRNRLLSRGPRTRLPAETVRDAALAISGLLSDQQFGPPVHPPIPDGVWNPFASGDKWNTPDASNPDRYRRTIYTYTKRTIPYPIMASFDAPSREFCAPRRQPSNSPTQALMTLNDATFHEASEALASRMAAAGSAVDKQIALGFSLAVCREPTTRELAELVSVYGRLEQIHQAAAETAQQNTAASETAETTSNEVPAPSSKDQTSTTEERDQGSQPESTDSDQPTIAEEAPELNLSLVSIASVLLNLDEVLNK